MAVEYLDPFSLVYDTLWAAVEENEFLKNAVRPGNRIKFIKDTADHEPRKTQVTPGSTPELALLPDFFVPQITLGNSQASMERTWNWVIRTGDRLLHKALFPVEYHLFLAMVDAKKKLLKLKWEGNSLVSHFSVDRGSEGLPKVEGDEFHPTNISWYSVWSMTTKLNLAVRQAQ